MEYWLPMIYMAAMGLALFVYVILDGYDLGVGMLLPLAEESEKDVMIASIGPFWDANETWIVLGVGILLIAFPKAHGLVLTTLYIPVTIMLMGLILRGVAFDLRVKAGDHRRTLWNRAFAIGSLVASMAQGWMLGAYVTGLQSTPISYLFAALIALTLPALYLVLGCGWLLIKTEHDLQRKALRWAKVAILPMGLGLLLVSIATPIVSPTIAEKWFSLPNAIYLAPIPILSAAIFFVLLFRLGAQSRSTQSSSTQSAGTQSVKNQSIEATSSFAWLYLGTVGICTLASLGLAYSLFPYVVIDQLTIWESAASVKSLQFTLVGVVITLPIIIAYTVLVYRIFDGKATALSYE